MLMCNAQCDINETVVLQAAKYMVSLGLSVSLMSQDQPFVHVSD